MFRKISFVVVMLSCIQFGDFANAQSSQFMRGDHNQDRAVNIGDAVGILGFLFSSGASPICEDASDINDDGSINSFMKIEFDQEPNYPYVPNTMIKYWCSGKLH